MRRTDTLLWSQPKAIAQLSEKSKETWPVQRQVILLVADKADGCLDWMYLEHNSVFVQWSIVLLTEALKFIACSTPTSGRISYASISLSGINISFFLSFRLRRSRFYIGLKNQMPDADWFSRGGQVVFLWLFEANKPERNAITEAGKTSS